MAFDFIKKFFKQEKNIYTPIDPDLIKRDNTVKRQQQEIQTLKAQLSKIISIEKEKREKVDEKQKENEFNKKLVKQELDLKAKRYGKIIKLGKFYKHLFEDKKFREELEIRDKNNEVVLGKFGDFVILEGGKFGIIDKEGNLMSYGKKLHQVLYKPDGFENQAKDKKFLIPMDKDGNFMEDIEYKEIPEPLDAEFESDGTIKQIKWSKIKTSEVKKIIAQKIETINQLSNDLETQENISMKLKKELDDFKRSISQYKLKSQIDETNLSKSLFSFNETNKHFAEVHAQNVKLMELKATYESIIDKKDEIIENVIAKLDKYNEPRYQLIKDDIHRDLAFYKKVLPERIEEKIEMPPEPIQIAQPGEVIKK